MTDGLETPSHGNSAKPGLNRKAKASPLPGINKTMKTRYIRMAKRTGISILAVFSIPFLIPFQMMIVVADMNITARSNCRGQLPMDFPKASSEGEVYPAELHFRHEKNEVMVLPAITL